MYVYNKKDKIKINELEICFTVLPLLRLLNAMTVVSCDSIFCLAMDMFEGR